jgi:MFS family permease
MDKNVGVYKGWIVVGASFVTYMVVWGGVWYSFSVFLNIFVRDFQWGRGEVAGVFSIFVSIICLSAPLVGRTFDYFGPKYIMPVAAMFLGANLFLCIRINSLFDFYLYYGIGCGIGMSFLLFTAQAPIITRWFHTHRATAMGLGLSGGGIGMMVFVPLIQRVAINSGWRAGFLLLSAAVVFLVFPASFILAKLPRKGETQHEKGLLSWRKGTSRKKTRVVTMDPSWARKIWTPREALRTRRFWYLFFAGVTGSSLVVQTIFSHFIIMTTDTGYSSVFSSKMLGLAGLMGTAGFLFWGKLADRIGREWGYTLGTACLFGGLFSLFLMKWVEGLPVFLLFATLFGFGYGSRAPLMQSICADLFQGPHFSSILGMYQTSLAVGVVGPWIAGVVAENLKSYQPIILFLMGATFLSAFFVWRAAPRHIRRIERRAQIAIKPRI